MAKNTKMLKYHILNLDLLSFVFYCLITCNAVVCLFWAPINPVSD